MTLSLRINDQEANMIKEYADILGVSVSEAIRTTMLERIEDEYDMKAYLEAKKEFENNPKVYTLEEVEEALNL